MKRFVIVVVQSITAACIEYLARARLNAFQSRKFAPEDNRTVMFSSSKANEQISFAAACCAAITNDIGGTVIGLRLRSGLRNPGSSCRRNFGLRLANGPGDDPILHSFWNLHYALGLGLADAEADGDLDALGLRDADGDRLALAEAEGLVKFRLSNTRQGDKYVFSRKSSLV